jgi:HSP20 family protein
MAVLVRWDPREWVTGLDWPPPFGLGWMRHQVAWPLARQEAQAWSPPCDVMTRGDDLVVRVDLPGIDPGRDVEVTVAEGLLCISGQRRHAERTGSEQVRRVESWVGSFERAIRVPESVDPDKVAATYQDGVLEVVVPQGAAPARRRIPVAVGSSTKAA